MFMRAKSLATIPILTEIICTRRYDPHHLIESTVGFVIIYTYLEKKKHFYTACWDYVVIVMHVAV